ncbi:MAG: phage portal protein [Phycisphaerales bacterium]
MRTVLSKWQQSLADGLDRVLLAVSPKRAYLRRAYRFAYDALDRSRTRKPRTGLGGTGDAHLTEQALSNLREICRDMGRNNPIVKGLFATETKGVVGSETKVEARTADEQWNEAAERLWKAEMVDRPCDVTGRLDIHKLLSLAYKSYRRDGDDFVVFGDETLWLVEGEQCGTPQGAQGGERFDVTNGVATRKSDGRVIGYYIGRPDRWGYIQANAYGKFTVDRVHHVFHPDRVSYTRGEQALTPVVNQRASRTLGGSTGLDLIPGQFS